MREGSGRWLYIAAAAVSAATAAVVWKLWTSQDKPPRCDKEKNESGVLPLCVLAEALEFHEEKVKTKESTSSDDQLTPTSEHRQEDVEDLLVVDRVSSESVIRRNKKSTNSSGIESQNSNVPGLQKIFLKTYGCSHNTSDSEFMMGLLKEYGYSIVEHLDEADVCVLNSCTVKNPSQEAFVSLVKKAQEKEKRVVVAGCVPQADRKLKALNEVSVVGITQIDRIVEVVEETLKGSTVRLLSKKSLPTLDLPKVRRNPFVEIVPLSTGCLGACTYCKTKHARGKLGSYSKSALLQRIERSISEDVQQIWLTSEDTGAYGLDIGTNIADLLEDVLQILQRYNDDTAGRHIMLRLGMTNPPYMAKHVKSIAKCLNHPNVFEFLHIPVQSGSNRVLSDMVREYTREEFISLVDILRYEVPDISIATDIICGFPTETEDDHLQTLSLLKEYHFPVVNISQMYPRPGTPAAKMKKLPSQTVKRRSGEVTALFESYKNFDWLLNSVQQVWFSEHSRRSNHTVGHTKQYVKVLVPKDDNLLGTNKRVLIKATEKWHVNGELM